MIEFFLAAIILVLLILLFLLFKRASSLEEKLSQLSSSKDSQSIKYGQLTEQWIPFSKDFPYNSKNFKFLGQPIDGIAFEEDKIVLCEFKTNTSTLSEKQKQIKELVERKKVEWLEFKIK